MSLPPHPVNVLHADPALEAPGDDRETLEFVHWRYPAPQEERLPAHGALRRRHRRRAVLHDHPFEIRDHVVATRDGTSSPGPTPSRSIFDTLCSDTFHDGAADIDFI